MTGKRVVTGVGAAVAAVLLLSACDGFRTASQQYTENEPLAQPVSEVRIDNGSGTIRIRVGAQPSVRRTVHHSGQRPGATHRVDGQALVLEDCGRGDCAVDYEVVLPAAAKVTAEIGSGNVELAGMSQANVRIGSGDVVVRDVPGPVTVDSGSGNVDISGIGQATVIDGGSGDIRIADVRAALTVRSGSGRVEARDLGGRTAVQASSGDVALVLAGAQDVTAHVNSGNLDVRVPRDARFRLTAHTDTGEHAVRVGNDPAAANLLQLSTDSGDLTVDYR